MNTLRAEWTKVRTVAGPGGTTTVERTVTRKPIIHGYAHVWLCSSAATGTILTIPWTRRSRAARVTGSDRSRRSA